MTDDDVRVIVCIRVEDLDADEAIGGAAPVKCEKCQHFVWIAPTSVAMIAEDLAHVYHVWCNQCAWPRLQHEETELRLAPGAWPELRRALGMNDDETELP